jgi:hypothetical protein
MFGSIIPPFALAEGDREGVGAAPPGSILPGLEAGPGSEPGSEETSLEEFPIAPGEEVTEEVVPSAPAETEPTPPMAAPPAVVTEPPVTSEMVPPPPASEPAPAPEPAPVYGTEEPELSYEPPPADAPPVENEAIIAPSGGAAENGHSQRSGSRTASEAPESEAPPAEEPAPAPAPAPEPATSISPSSDRAGSLKGHVSYTVVEGDCLWAIAEGILPAGATIAEIEAEVARLWTLNAQRIGTGDPNLILAGTVLRIR